MVRFNNEESSLCCELFFRWDHFSSIQTHMDTAGAGLTFPNIEKPQYSCFWEFQCTRNDPQNLPFRPGPPKNIFITFLRYFKTICFKFIVLVFFSFVHFLYSHNNNIISHSDPEAQPWGGPKADISEALSPTKTGVGGQSPRLTLGL